MFRRAGSIRGDYGVISAPACASTGPIEISYAGQAMTTFNRIFTTERLLQIIVILAATIAMKLMA
ncbi:MULTISPECIES: hypothetical protein [Bradyrhizobium]|jgi:hypothetical protein|nr:hypothetical protein [Bradyrhizobium japonicum]AJA64941.1 hypothetical protein RN69_35050 [Bradyrhizobium japonicum]MBR0765247.1 hypothetical protein [Bradyrhizobium japonicum]MCS3538059.1 hypothetical protein [Bradyrhizobium japonicum]MCS3985854.1 hypothetical protein [Bradyrhizobium japonicum]MCS4019330.1 hypothetical protein [Bradyrhizobium japonicum]